MKHLFLVTSAIDTKFGRWSSDERLQQTIRTLKSIRERIPDALIYVLESSATKIDSSITDTLLQHCNTVFDFSGDETINLLYNNTDNWDIIKNMTELLVFNRALVMLEEKSLLDDINRIHKLSGRYELNDFFDPSLYENTDKIVFAKSEQSYLNEINLVVPVPFYYISRLWSWSTKDQPLIKHFYSQALTEFKDHLSANTYIDIEHLLYKLLPKDHIIEVPKIGVEGLVGYHAYFRKD